MATLTIRNLPDEVRDRLRVRAAQNSRSMEAEVKIILDRALPRDPTIDRHRVLREIQAEIASLPGYDPTKLWSDQLIAERRAEAARELAKEAHEQAELVKRHK